MKFIKLKLKNFKPYYSRGEPHEIVFYEETRKEENITLNIGQTGFGKTSISEAILWCLFGERYRKNWEEFVNTLHIDVMKEMKEKEAEMTVELVFEIKGENYRAIRTGSYNIPENTKSKNSELTILKHGEPLIDPESFIRINFPRIALMEYFIFDADDILNKFRDNQEKTISDHINKLVGVEKLDRIIKSLDRVHDLYGNEIVSIESQIRDDITDKIEDYKINVKGKEDAIKMLKSSIENLTKKKRELFKGAPTPQEEEFCNLIDQRDSFEEQIIDLNNTFKEKNIIGNMDLLLIENIISSCMEKIETQKTSKGDFDGSLKIIQSSLGNDYKGVFFKEKDITKLIKKGTKIESSNYDDINKLDFEPGEEKKAEAMTTLCDYQISLTPLKSDFDSFRVKYEGFRVKLFDVRNKIDQIGETEKNKELKKKFDQFNEYENSIKIAQKSKKGIEDEKIEIERKIENLRAELELNQDQKKLVKQIENKQHIIKELIEISKKSREVFLRELINYVNRKASEFLRNTVKDTMRFHSINIGSDYQFEVLQKNGVALKQNQINKGALTISMLSFFFGLSNFLEKGIPYVIDNPLIRLDPGHDKRLIEQLSENNDQIILHLIPGKEYTRDSFTWLKDNINIQNWIHRNEYLHGELISSIERKDEDDIIDFDITKF